MRRILLLRRKAAFELPLLDAEHVREYGPERAPGRARPASHARAEPRLRPSAGALDPCGRVATVLQRLFPDSGRAHGIRAAEQAAARVWPGPPNRQRAPGAPRALV